MDRFTLMSCGGRKFEQKGGKKTQKKRHPPDTDKRSVFKVLVSSLRFHKDKEVTQLFAWKSCYLDFHQLHSGGHGAALSTKKQFSLYCNSGSLLGWLLLLQRFCCPVFHKSLQIKEWFGSFGSIGVKKHQNLYFICHRYHQVMK